MAPQRTRARVMELLTEVSHKLPINSTTDPVGKIKGNPIFDQYTMAPADADWNQKHPDDPINCWQDRFNYDWITRPRKGLDKRNTTACNQFSGQIILLAGGPNLGGINLRSSLDIVGKPYAWVQAGGAATPKGGDVLDFGQHIGMCFTQPGGAFQHIDGGQGGPNTGYDIIDYGKGALGTVIGWADIDMVFGAAPADSSAPAWLAGWWTMTWQGTRYWYCFGQGGFAQYQKSAPANPRQLPSQYQKHDGGTYTMTGPDTVTVKWRITGSVEKWTRGGMSGGKPTMTGIYNNSEMLSATKLTP